MKYLWTRGRSRKFSNGIQILREYFDWKILILMEVYAYTKHNELHVVRYFFFFFISSYYRVGEIVTQSYNPTSVFLNVTVQRRTIKTNFSDKKYLTSGALCHSVIKIFPLRDPVLPIFVIKRNNPRLITIVTRLL